MQLSEIVDEDADPFGTAYVWKTGGANHAANEAAVAATPGSWTMKYAGMTAGEIRSTGYDGNTFIVRVKTLDGSSPGTKELELTDWDTGPVFFMNAGGIISQPGTCGKDSWQTSGINGFIPAIEGADVVTHGHANVETVNIYGQFKSRGKVMPGEATTASGQTGGYAYNGFLPGTDYRDQWHYIAGTMGASCYVTALALVST